MEQLGTIDGIPIYFTDEFMDVRVNSQNDNYIIYKKKVYQYGEHIGNYNRSKQSISWLPQERTQEKSKDTVASGEKTWEELIAPIDKMIKEMLEREL